MKNSRSWSPKNIPDTCQPTARIRAARHRRRLRVSLQGHGIRLAFTAFVAKKFHASGLSTRTFADTAAANLRMATMQLMGMRAGPRVRSIPNVRRRIAIEFVSEPPEMIKIRQAAQNLDTAIAKAQPILDHRSAEISS